MSTRKAFLIAGAIAAAATQTAAADAAPSPRAKGAKLDFDLDAFNALLDGSQSHKHLFASVEINGGEVFGAMRNTLNAYRDIGTTLSDVYPVAVLYHGVSILLAFDDTIWDRYVIPLGAKLPKSGGPAKQIASVRKEGGRGNPCLRRQGGDNDTSIPSLISDSDARFFVCNNAARGLSDYIGSNLSEHPDQVYADLSHHLVQNAMLVPAGVWAVHAIQEQRFTLLQTSLSAPPSG
jgi:hypothetical protein